MNNHSKLLTLGFEYQKHNETDTHLYTRKRTQYGPREFIRIKRIIGGSAETTLQLQEVSDETLEIILERIKEIKLA